MYHAPKLCWTCLKFFDCLNESKLRKVAEGCSDYRQERNYYKQTDQLKCWETYWKLEDKDAWDYGLFLLFYLWRSLQMPLKRGSHLWTSHQVVFYLPREMLPCLWSVYQRRLLRQVFNYRSFWKTSGDALVPLFYQIWPIKKSLPLLQPMA